MIITSFRHFDKIISRIKRERTLMSDSKTDLRHMGFRRRAMQLEWNEQILSISDMRQRSASKKYSSLLVKVDF